MIESDNFMLFLLLKAGNCNMGDYPDWKDAVIDGPGCGLCPSNMPNCDA